MEIVSHTFGRRLVSMCEYAVLHPFYHYALFDTEFPLEKMARHHWTHQMEVLEGVASHYDRLFVFCGGVSAYNDSAITSSLQECCPGCRVSGP